MDLCYKWSLNRELLRVGKGVSWKGLSGLKRNKGNVPQWVTGSVNECSINYRKTEGNLFLQLFWD